MKAFLKNSRISPKKAALIADLVRNKKVTEALDLLKFTPKKGAKIMTKVIKSAAANAENNFKQDRKTLYISEIRVNKGLNYRRSVPISRGRIHPILKRNSNIWVVVSPEAKPSDDKKVKAESKKVDKKVEKNVKADTKKVEKKAEKKSKVEPKKADVKAKAEPKKETAAKTPESKPKK